MTDQHRATPEQWEVVEVCSEEGKIPWPTADCILELRARIESLEAARRPKPPSLKEEALAALDEMSIEPCLINGVDVNAAVRAKYNTIRTALEAPMTELRAASAEARPAGGLVERVAMALDSGCPQDEYVINDCRAAIREVAKWLRENDCGYNVIRWLEQEANQ